MSITQQEVTIYTEAVGTITVVATLEAASPALIQYVNENRTYLDGVRESIDADLSQFTDAIDNDVQTFVDAAGNTRLSWRALEDFAQVADYEAIQTQVAAQAQAIEDAQAQVSEQGSVLDTLPGIHGGYNTRLNELETSDAVRDANIASVSELAADNQSGLEVIILTQDLHDMHLETLDQDTAAFAARTANLEITYADQNRMLESLDVSRQDHETRIIDLEFITDADAQFARFAVIDTKNDEQDARLDIQTDILASEQLTREEADTALSTLLAQETVERESADTVLTGLHSQEKADRQSVDTALNALIIQESADRETADTALSSALDTEQLAREGADTALSALLVEETVERTAGDSALAADITSLDTALSARIDTLDAQGTSAASAAVTLTGDQSISGTKTFTDDIVVNGEALIHQATIKSSGQLDVGDAVVTLNAGESGTPSLDSGFSIERGTQTNAQLLWDEATDAWKAGLEGALEPLALQPDLDTEVAARALADTALQTAISTRAPQSELTTEVVNRLSADSALQSHIDTLQSAIDALPTETDVDLSGVVTLADSQSITGAKTFTGDVTLMRGSLKILDIDDDSVVLTTEDTANNRETTVAVEPQGFSVESATPSSGYAEASVWPSGMVSLRTHAGTELEDECRLSLLNGRVSLTSYPTFPTWKQLTLDSDGFKVKDNETGAELSFAPRADDASSFTLKMDSRNVMYYSGSNNRVSFASDVQISAMGTATTSAVTKSYVDDNFVDLTSTQVVGGSKSFSGYLTAEAGLQVEGSITSAQSAVTLDKPLIAPSATLSGKLTVDASYASIDLNSSSAGATTALEFKSAGLKRGTLYHSENDRAMKLVVRDDAQAATNYIHLLADYALVGGYVRTNAAQPSDVNSLTRKDYVDDNFLPLAGGGEISGNIYLKNTANGNPNIKLKSGSTTADPADADITGLNMYYAYNSDTAVIEKPGTTGRYDGSGSSSTQMLLTPGNAYFNKPIMCAAAPSAGSHLTRRDYVDNNFLPLSGGTMSGGVTFDGSQAFNGYNTFNGTTKFVANPLVRRDGYPSLTLDRTNVDNAYGVHQILFQADSVNKGYIKYDQNGEKMLFSVDIDGGTATDIEINDGGLEINKAITTTALTIDAVYPKIDLYATEDSAINYHVGTAKRAVSFYDASAQTLKHYVTNSSGTFQNEIQVRQDYTSSQKPVITQSPQPDLDHSLTRKDYVDDLIAALEARIAALE